MSNSGPHGNAENGLRRKNEQQAAIVREIFEDYASGKSPRTIAKVLNARHVPGPSGGTWSPSTINGNASRGTGILNNELYIGRLVWNRLRYVKNPTTGRRQSRLNPRDQWVIKEVPELRIVPQDLWDRVKERQAAMARNTRPDRTAKAAGSFWMHQRPRYLLSGLIKCGCCGANYTKYGANRFACAGSRDRGTCSNKLSIRGDVLEASILSGLQTRLMEPERFEQFAREFVAETNRQRTVVTAARAATRAAVDKLNRQINRLVDAIAEGAGLYVIRGGILESKSIVRRLPGRANNRINEDAPN